MVTALTPIQTLKFRSPQPKPLFSHKPPSISSPHTFRAGKLSLSAATSSAAATGTISASGPTSPPSPSHSKHGSAPHDFGVRRR
ncbi:hypothetical protein Fmac_004460 [Flemingia macrophylla]|uniref:Uncharacterized protein n=1 Tax=Flemingia macrophylla TaxID=520843 RepID=A0ABD1N7M3_9FABA